MTTRSINAYLVIDKKKVLCESFTCTRPTYGSIGSFSAVTSREILKQAGLNLYQTGQSAMYPGKKGAGQIPTYIYVEDAGKSSKHLLFGGELDSVEVDYDTDTWTISGRDWAGYLADLRTTIISQQTSAGTSGNGVSACTSAGKIAPPGMTSALMSPASGIATINQQNITPSQYAYEIAVQMRFNPQVYTVPNEVPIGTMMANSFVNAETPRPIWSVLQFCARSLGWECYVDPSKNLYFGPIPNKSPFHVTWNDPKGKIPSNSLEISYNPRRNHNFLVIVYTYDYGLVTLNQAAVAIIGPATLQAAKAAYPTVNVSGNVLIAGTNGAPSSQNLAALFTNLGKPVYTFMMPKAMTVAQAQQHALSKALEIAKRELITKFRIDGDDSMEPMQKLVLSGDLGDFAGPGYYINCIEHSFDMEDGWYTHIHAWTVPPILPGESFGATTNGIVDNARATLFKPPGAN